MTDDDDRHDGSAAPESGESEATRRGLRRSLAGGVTAVFTAALVVTAAVAAVVSSFGLPAWLVFLICCGTGLPVGAWLLNRHLQEVTEVVRALGDGISSLRDNDFSITSRSPAATSSASW